MNFEDKLASLFHSLSENLQPPNTSQDYLFFDYIEFYAFFYGDEVYKTELLDYFSDCDVNILKYVNEDDNRRETAINTIFSCLEYRSSLLGEYYPYDVNHNSIELKPELSVGNKAYIVLLICSMLGKFSEFQSDLTSEFEEIICIVLEKMFPESVIKSFGKNSDYAGTAQEKIRNLAIELNIMTREHEILKVRGNQGLDLIVWQPFKDTVPNMSISLVQCACGKQWTSKFLFITDSVDTLNYHS